MLTALRALGIAYDEVVQTLEDDAVAAFDTSWTRLAVHPDGALRAGGPGPGARPTDDTVTEAHSP